MSDGEVLSRRELEVLAAVADGQRYFEIARAQRRTRETIRSQALSARRKLDAATLAQAVAVAFRLGLLT